MPKEGEWKPLDVAQLERNIQEVFRTGDIGKLSEATYRFITLHMGFIAHYDRYGFMGVYADLGLLREKLQTSEYSRDPDYNLNWAARKESDSQFLKWYGYPYCHSVAEGIRRIVKAARNYQPPLPKPPEPAQVNVVIGVFAGCVDHVSAWELASDANGQRDRLRTDYGIVPGSEAESQHSIEIRCVPVQGPGSPSKPA